jgi:hypothetical protein
MKKTKRPTLEPIEQWFRGIKYRSKLEACWAAFFSELDLVADYEPQAYRLDAGCYTPDFLLQEVQTAGGRGLWIEVKATQPSFYPDHVAIYQEIVMTTALPLALVWGTPFSHVAGAPLGAFWKPGDDPQICEQVYQLRNFSITSIFTCFNLEYSDACYSRAATEAQRAVRWAHHKAPELEQAVAEGWESR